MSAQKRILVVEDETVIAFYMEEALSELGHRVQIAGSTTAAEAVLADEEIDLVVLDHHLQDGTSLRLAEQLQLLGVPFVVCSGVDPSELGGAFQGATLLSKPFTTEGLVGAVASLAREEA